MNDNFRKKYIQINIKIEFKLNYFINRKKNFKTCAFLF